ncbi:GAF and ANTAR domain-containing protein [Actinoplanes teichomyceticus]|uniref:GAF domain-containing protein n=1 Tax=Actinoplanes teichomyceticus TaxID=1867 RepID=A0A561VLI7_ACTTI|nr:GAF and ANTAR domain-containing protein [Actinoplanes teichomyceticus]TWG12467.1 GAF domain-containing protein [Actinoplanes teichomyceticus]GIF13832.1 transcriptional regulator [Actinoplanes teichomyceticus]
MARVSAERLATIFVEVAAAPADGVDLPEFLHLLTDRARVLAGTAAAGLILADERGQPGLTAASDESARLIELVEVRDREGPCLDAFRTGEAVQVDLARAGPRWPRFAAHATSAGFRSVHAVPMRLRDQVVGALGVFGTGDGPTGGDALILRAVTDVATIALLQQRRIRRGAVLTEQLQRALDSRIVIEQAKGVLAQARGISVDEAFLIIRAHARAHQQRLTDLCHLIVTDLAALPELAER